MYKQKIKLLLIIILLSALYGCWDSIGIPEKNIVTVVIVDKTETGYAFYVELPLFGGKKEEQDGGGSSKNSIYIKSEGETFADARFDLDTKSNKPIYLGAVQSVILTQRMAESGIEEYVYRLRRIPDYRKTIKIVVTTEEPEDLLNANTENNKLLGFAIEDLFQSSMKLGQAVAFSLTDILEIINSPNKAYYIPVVAVEEKEIYISGYSVFYYNKTIGFIPIKESKGIIMFHSDKPIIRDVVQYQENQYSMEIRFSKRKHRVIYQDGQIIYTFNYKCKATLLYIDKKHAVTEQIMEGLAKELEKKIETTLLESINTSQQEYGYDYLKFYTFFRIKYPELAKTLNWKTEFPKAKFNVEVNVDLKMSGNINYNPYEE